MLLLLTTILLAACRPSTGTKPDGSEADSEKPPTAAASDESVTPTTDSQASDEAVDLPLVVFLGDSLTAGYGLDEEQAFPALVAEHFADAGRPIEVVNAGISGDTTAGGLHRLDWLLRQQPDILVVCLGANDGLRGVDLSSSEENLRQIITQAKAKDVQVLLVGMLIPPNYGPDYSQQFAALYPKLADELEVPLLPFLLEGVAANPDLNLADGIHPNADGHAILATTVMQALQPLLGPSATGANTTSHLGDTHTMQQRYEDTWNLLGKSPGDSYALLAAAYGEPQRHYHTMEHLREGFEVLDSLVAPAERDAALELALWFHDVVYDVHRDDNEAHSAAWSSRLLRRAAVLAEVEQRVTDLILATRHVDAAAATPAAQLLVDIDLSILGRDAERFDQYEAQIRREYDWVDEEIFRPTRAGILQRFLDREVIYPTPVLRARFEAQARTNLRRCIDRLG